MNSHVFRVLLCAFVMSATLTASPQVQAEAPTAEKRSQWPVTKRRYGANPLAKLPILRAQLANGLRVVMSPDATVPTIAVAVYYDVGSRNEEKGRSGFAHLFEHMMFQGSANVKKGEHFSLIMNRGGSMNGTTNADRTNYFATLPSSELALGLWLEADRMRSLAITQSNFENQRQTVMEERRQSYDNQPYAPSMLRINEMAYGDYWPYAHSTIGDMADLQKAPLSAVQEFFDQYYAPNNAVLSVAGDFDPAEAMTLIKQYFGQIKRRKTPAYNPPKFVPPAATTASIDDANAQLPAFHVSYPIPPNRHEEHYALEVASLILADGESSPLYQKLVKELELCQSIDVSTDDRRGPDLFSIWAVVSAGHTGEEARKVIFSVIDAMAAGNIPDKALQKARNRIRSYFIFSLQSNLARARRLAEYELYWQDATLVRGELERYLAVSLDDVKAVMQRYLGADHRIVLDVLPSSAQSTPSSSGKK